ESRHRVDTSSDEMVIVEEAFDKDYLSGASRKTVWRKVRATAPAQVEVAGHTGFIVDDGSRPKGSDPPPLVAPGAAKSSRPALVGVDAGRMHLPVVVAVLGEGAASRLGRRDDAEAG